MNGEGSRLIRIDTGKEGYVQKFPSTAVPEKDTKPAVKRGKYDGMSRKVKRRKMAIEEDIAEGRLQSQAASIRAAKKSARPTKIGIPVPPPTKKAPAGTKKGGKRSAFDDKEKKGSAHEGMRAKKVKVGLNKGKGGNGGGKGPKGKSKGKR